MNGTGSDKIETPLGRLKRKLGRGGLLEEKLYAGTALRALTGPEHSREEVFGELCAALQGNDKELKRAIFKEMGEQAGSMFRSRGVKREHALYLLEEATDHIGGHHVKGKQCDEATSLAALGALKKISDAHGLGLNVKNLEDAHGNRGDRRALVNKARGVLQKWVENRV